MPYDFDKVIDRRHSDSMKWRVYGEDVLPMWVADMDFRSPEPVIAALRERVEHGVFGYALPTPRLLEVLCERMQQLYQWTVTPEQIVLIPGLVAGINVACRAIGTPGAGVLVQTPVYSPFLGAPPAQGLRADLAALSCVATGRTLRYEVDFDVFEAAIQPDTRLFLACHPHNPVGREFDRDELLRMAGICLRHNMVICSDEIHCDLLLDGRQHTPFAALAPEIADRTITLMAPSKTFNLAGLGCSFAIVPNVDLRKALMRARGGIVPGVNALGMVAAQAAYEHGGEWLAALQRYLTANRDALTAYVDAHFPRVRYTVPEATYLGWLDFRAAGFEGSPRDFFLHNARVALGEGKGFGPGGEGFARVNFGCPRSVLMQSLEQMRAAMSLALVQ